MHATWSINLIVLDFIASRFQPRFGFYRHTKRTRYLWHNVRFDVDKVTQGQVSLHLYCFFLVTVIPQISHIYSSALRYYSDGSGIDSRWWDFFFRGSSRKNHVPWGRLSLWKWVPGISPGVKGAGVYGWRPTTFVVPKLEIIRGLNLPGTPKATSACRGTPLLFNFIIDEK